MEARRKPQKSSTDMATCEEVGQIGSVTTVQEQYLQDTEASEIAFPTWLLKDSFSVRTTSSFGADTVRHTSLVYPADSFWNGRDGGCMYGPLQ